MEPDSSRACSPVPLQPISPERVNQQRDIFSSFRAGGGHSRDSSVSDKINQFNTLAMQSKQLERKTADAALKRAMLGREEAEAEMRRYRDEARSLRKQVEEGKDRERKVGERLETVMVCAARVRRVLSSKSDADPYLTLGELRSRKGDLCPYSGIMGEGDPTSAKGDVQVTERHRQATGGTQVSPTGAKVCRGEP